MYTGFKNDIVSSGIMSKVEIIPVGAPLGSGDLSPEYSRDGSTKMHAVDNSVGFTPENVVTAPTFTMLGVSFRDMLIGALVAVGKDDTLPVLTGIKFEWSNNEITVITTDRYRMVVGVTRKESYAVTVGEGGFLLPRTVAAELVKVLPKKIAWNNSEHDMITVTLVGRDTVTIEYGDPSERIVRPVRTIDGEFPKWRSLVPTDEMLSQGSVTFASYNPTYLADVAKIPHWKDAPIRFRFTTNLKPAMLDYVEAHNGVKWDYLLMPVRITG